MDLVLVLPGTVPVVEMRHYQVSTYSIWYMYDSTFRAVVVVVAGTCTEVQVQ
jgi:hypothetical protein